MSKSKSNEMSVKSQVLSKQGSMSSHHSSVVNCKSVNKELGLIGMCRCVAMQGQPVAFCFGILPDQKWTLSYVITQVSQTAAKCQEIR